MAMKLKPPPEMVCWCSLDMEWKASPGGKFAPDSNRFPQVEMTLFGPQGVLDRAVRWFL